MVVLCWLTLLSSTTTTTVTALNIFDQQWDGRSSDSSVLRKWRFLGPFTCGKNEVDGNPVAAVGTQGILEAIHNTKLQLYSDITSTGVVGWSKVNGVSSSGVVTITKETWGSEKDLDWNTLYRTLDPLVLEWQGSLVTAIFIQPPAGQTTALVMFSCSGAPAVEVFPSSYVDEEEEEEQQQRRRRR